ncbi:MAG: IS1595 family transposase [Candidatus Levyibacteriota bacterium]|nr:MAG: IS1595 family transposase [Candidatus Levybacteria bacterium]
MSEKFSLRSFKQKYGTHQDCLEAIKQLRFPDPFTCPKCNTMQKFYPVSGRTAYACNSCGNHIYPLAGTIFEKSTTPLDLWFFAMYLMTQTRSGTSAKQLERMLGVTYKTAWRMFKQIRLLMVQSPSLLDGIVEIDETYFGGKGKNRAYQWHGGVEEKEIIMGIVKRKGTAYAKHIPDTKKWTLINQIKQHVDPKAHVMTDDLASYRHLYDHGFYKHYSVNHSNREYVRHHLFHTNNVEGLWSHIKRGVYGVYRKVSKKYLQAYIDEYTWRYNNRNYIGGMFDILLKQVTEVKIIKE